MTTSLSMPDPSGTPGPERIDPSVTESVATTRSPHFGHHVVEFHQRRSDRRLPAPVGGMQDAEHRRHVDSPGATGRLVGRRRGGRGARHTSVDRYLIGFIDICATAGLGLIAKPGPFVDSEMLGGAPGGPKRGPGQPCRGGRMTTSMSGRVQGGDPGRVRAGATTTCPPKGERGRRTKMLKVPSFAGSGHGPSGPSS